MSSPVLQYNPLGSPPMSSSFQRQGYLIYWPNIVNLTGGVAATDLDAQNIKFLPNNSMIIVVIPNRGLSIWERVADATSPASNVEGGKIKPTNYDPVNNAWILTRQSGH